MHRIDTPTAQVDKFGSGKNGFTRGNPQTGVPATALDDDYFDAVQEELARVVEAAGLTLKKTDRAQVLASIKLLIGSETNTKYLKVASNLAEIKAAGAAAVTATLLNLGLGDAAKRSVGTGANQIPDMSSFISSFAQNGYFKFPGGLIIQWGEVTGSTTGTVPANFPIPFPNALMSTALAIDLIGPSYATLQNQTLGGMSVNTWNSAGNRAALAIRYIAIGW
ncbi:gp53-like domain-containing protein [Yersinia enterocolitica]|uniref:gp53-like domain-containing protein n=1 Tax=Yersinia enterocolitica TaxID=630 RepID=UPI003F435F7A